MTVRRDDILFAAVLMAAGTVAAYVWLMVKG